MTPFPQTPLAPRLRLLTPLLAAAVLAAPATGRGDEGMWLFSSPPVEVLKSRHGFAPDQTWFDHVQRASVRVMSGGSGSFVSADGLLMSNHHVASDAIQKLSTADRDLLRDGFHARTLAEELPCKDLELNVLIDIEDVTARVNAAVPAGLPADQAAAARRAVQAEIEKQAADRSGYRCDVVTLFQGGAYHLYRYKQYTDVRLVFAPEQQIAFFGGDPDNFEYPRFCLDVAFLRAYEDGRPARVDHFLKWSRRGVSEGDLVLVSGHPGRTSRLLTLTELEYLRDHAYPAALERLYREEVSLSAWSARSTENQRRAKDDLFSIQNSRKARVGGLAGLQDPAFLGRIAEAEKTFRARLETAPEWASARQAYDRIATSQSVIQQNAERYRMLENAWGLRGELFSLARTLLRSAAERGLPNGDRLREFRDSNRTSLELDLFSSRPIHEDLEILHLADSLTHLTSTLGATDPVVARVLAGKSPRQRAAELVAGTRLRDVAVRKSLYALDLAALRAAADPMIEVAAAVDAEARAVRKTMEAQDETKRQAHAEIARARFALQGSGNYPDATSTLRLAFGLVQGYADSGTTAPAFTEFAGLYQRAQAQNQQPPFDLPERWSKRRGKLDLRTPFNFVSTADIIGGNSGSPTVDRHGEVVGLIFDGNLPSLVLDFAYDDQQARALSVDSRAILEALEKVYGAKNLVQELTSGQVNRR
ncbi:MAG: S46 family peptidase [Verrucomicrobiales bacterium]|nr:S46 family peptidase [Verrucomicrobiales bacterium]